MKILSTLMVFLFSIQVHAKQVKLVLNWKPEPEFGGFYAAQLKGHFKKHSLDVEIVPGGSGTPTVQMIAANQAEFGIASGEEVIISRSRGTDVIGLFAVYQTSPYAFLVHPERSISSIGELFTAPGTISVQTGLPFYMYLEKKFGKPKAKVVPQLGGISNFLRDPTFSQQGFVTSEPFQIQKKGLKVRTLLVSKEGYDSYLTVLIARRDFVEKNNGLVEKFVAAVREGWKDYLKNPKEVNEYMHKLNPSMDLQAFDESSRAQESLIETQLTKKHGLGYMTKEHWEQNAKQLKEIGLIREVSKPEALFENP